MIRVGAVNIDTSHPLGFGEVMEKSDRARYVGVYNDSFRDDGEVEGFIRRFGLEKRCGTLEELADMCDIGFIHGCNWDDHLRCMEPFLERGKPVFVDKPLVGNLRDVKRLREQAAQGHIILGASSARYAYEIREFLSVSAEERGEIVQVYGTSGVDEFNYGIHIAEAMGGLLGTGAELVRYAGRGNAGGQYAETCCVQYKSGPTACFTTFTGIWQPFTLTIMTTKNTWQIRLDSNRLYAALLEQICNYLEGKPHILADINALLESVEIMLAAAASRDLGGAGVRLEDLREDGPCYNGARFCAEYGAAAGQLYAGF